MIQFSDYPLEVIFVGSIVVILAASEIGRQFGARATEGGGTNVATLEGATLGLLALMIGFTFRWPCRASTRGATAS